MRRTTPPVTSPVALRRARSRTRAALWWERIWPRLLLPFAVAALFLVVSWTGVWSAVPEWARLALLGVFALAAVASLVPFFTLRKPGAEEVDKRLERANAIPHRPVTVHNDRQATGSDDPMASALWRAHQRRSRERLDALEAARARPNVSRLDPWAARALVPLALFVAFGFAPWLGGGSDRWDLVMEAFRSGEERAVDRARVDVWITPPDYTRKPPIFLARSEQLSSEGVVAARTVTVPEGSKLSVRTVGLAQGRVTFDPGFGPQAVAAGEAEATLPDRPAVRAYDLELQDSGDVTLGALVGGADRRLARYRVEVTPDRAPTIALAEDPSRARNGALELEYAVTDDYGVRTARGFVSPVEVGDGKAEPLVKAPVLDLPLPGRAATEGKGRVNRDLTAHPLAGSQVQLVLEATDDAEQTGRSAPHVFELPARNFTKPLARALVYERRKLALDRRRRADVVERLDLIANEYPEEFLPELSQFIGLRSARYRLENARNDDELREVVDYLWEIALAIEDGDLSAAERRLRDAQENLSKALEEGASDEEIARLMDELREAMAEMMREMARRAQENPQQAQPMDPNAQTMTERDLQKMLDRIEDLAKSGSRDAARELLAEMQRMMDNMQAGRPQQQQEGQQQGQDQFSEQMNKLGELLRKQQELMDQTFDMQRQQQEQRRQGSQQQQGQQQQGQQQGQPGQQQQDQQPGQQQGQGRQPMTAEQLEQALRDLQQQQGQLQQQLQDMQQALEGMGMQPSEGFGEAERQMGQAQGKLGEGRPGGAVGNQGQAMQALRQGAQQMMQQLQQMARQRGQQGQQGRGQGRGNGQQENQDPLGRQTRSRGPQLGDDVKVPDEIDAQRAREILDAIRERLGETTRRRLELDYLDRLLPNGGSR